MVTWVRLLQRQAGSIGRLGSGGARSGLASHRVTPAVLSGAAAGHDRVRDGTGWGHRALGHGHPPTPNVRRLACCVAR